MDYNLYWRLLLAFWAGWVSAECGSLKEFFLFKIKAGATLYWPSERFYSSTNNSIHWSFIFKFYFSLCRMNIDINLGWINIYVQPVGCITFSWQQLFKSTGNSMMQVMILDESSVHKKYCSPLVFLENSGLPMKPEMESKLVSSWNQSFVIMTSHILRQSVGANWEAGNLNISRPFWCNDIKCQDVPELHVQTRQWYVALQPDWISGNFCVREHCKKILNGNTHCRLA